MPKVSIWNFLSFFHPLSFKRPIQSVVSSTYPAINLQCSNSDLNQCYIFNTLLLWLYFQTAVLLLKLFGTVCLLFILQKVERERYTNINIGLNTHQKLLLKQIINSNWAWCYTQRSGLMTEVLSKIWTQKNLTANIRLSLLLLFPNCWTMYIPFLCNNPQ